MKKILIVLVLIFAITLPATSIDREVTRAALINKVGDLVKWCSDNGEYSSQSILLTLQASLIMKTDTTLVKITAEYSRLILESIKKADKNKI